MTDLPRRPLEPLERGAMFESSQLRALIDTAVDGILSIDETGRVTLCNPAAERIFGRRRADIVGQPVEQLMPEPFASSHAGFLRAYIETGVAKIIGIGRQVEGLRADGRVFPMHLSVGAFSDGDERHFVGIVRDLTAEAQTRERARDLQEQLETLGRHAAVSEMGAALAHELNQPLTAVDLFLVAAERELDRDPDRARELFARVRSEAARAAGIVRRIRQMVERADGEAAVFPLAGPVRDAIELCRVVERGPTAIEDRALPEGDVFGDPTRIRMIVANLVKNALDATEGRAARRVVVRGGNDDKDYKTPVLSIEVLDNGPGVPNAFAGKLFEPFASTKSRGLGIGLSICQTMAEAHGGRLTHVPPEDQREGLGGAMFRLELPRAEAVDGIEDEDREDGA